MVYLAEICRDISTWSLDILVLLDFCSVVSFGSVLALIQHNGRKPLSSGIQELKYSYHT